MTPYREKPVLDMTADGRFRTPLKPPIAARIAATALVVAVIAGGLAVAAIALYVASLRIPVVLGAGLVAYAAFRFQLRRRSPAGPVRSYRPDSFRR